MHHLLSTLIEEFQEKMATFKMGIAREVHFPEIPDKIMVAVGMRRTGKTYFLFQQIHELLKEIPITRILYLNFEDDRLYPTSQQQLRGLLDDFYTLHPENHGQLCYLFLDEIQNVDEWHRVIRRYFDSKKVKIYLTGSSAKLLSKEIATSLRGRSLATEIWPFSFKEFLQTHHMTFPDNSAFGKQKLDKLKEQLNVYLNQGGFPETTSLNPENRRRVLQEYVSVVIFRDIIERHEITNISLIRYMIKALLKNVGCSFSVYKFFNDLKSQAFSVGKTTVHDYLSYVEDAYLAFSIPLYAESLRKTQVNPRKIYAIDTGLVNAYTTGISKNIGHHFENLIYLDLRRAGHEVHYYLTQTRREVDFLSRDRQGEWHLYQVSWDINDPKTLARESLALQEAETELGIKGEIVTADTYLTSFLPGLSTL